MIEQYFQDSGWSYTRHSETTWITGIRSKVSNFQIFVQASDEWVFFFINPFVVAPEDESRRLRLYFHALRYNLEMNFAKLGLDADGDVFLAIEQPADNLTFAHFLQSLEGLSHHAEMIYIELFNLAHNPSGVKGRFDSELVGGDDDVRIGGRRLTIYTDEDGSPRVELDDEDED